MLIQCRDALISKYKLKIANLYNKFYIKVHDSMNYLLSIGFVLSEMYMFSVFNRIYDII